MSLEKFSGSFRKQESCLTLISTDIINSIDCALSLAIYVYIQSMPNDWEFKIDNVACHFNESCESIKIALKYLKKMGVLSGGEL